MPCYWGFIVSYVTLLSRMGVAAQTGSSSSDFSDCTGYIPHVRDGYCDVANNNDACGYDGGDCCPCTCEEGEDLAHTCGGGDGYNCVDPGVPDDCGATPSPAAIFGYPDCTGYMFGLGNGYCSADLNNEECGYDGGDCCRCTCLENAYYSSATSPAYNCGVFGYDCEDPAAPTDCATESPTPSPAASFGYPDCTGYMYNLQNSYCNDDLNNADCGYDGGDCCRCTCRDYLSFYDCGGYGYDCQDPAAPTDCATESPTPSPAASFGYPACTGYMYFLQNGYCNDDLNNADCGYDGGDCCRCTCRETGVVYDCSESEFDCQDPTAPTDCATEEPTPSPAAGGGYPNCAGPIYNLQNGYCNVDLNNADCGYDGGDCCECTCEDNDFNCGTNGFLCFDPACTSSESSGVSASTEGSDSSTRTSTVLGVVLSIGVVACCFGALCIHQCVSWKGVMAETSRGRRSREARPPAPARLYNPWRASAPPPPPQLRPPQPQSAHPLPPQPVSAPLANPQQARVMRSAAFMPTEMGVSNSGQVSGRPRWNDGSVAAAMACEDDSRHKAAIEESRRVQTIAEAMYQKKHRNSEPRSEEKSEERARVSDDRVGVDRAKFGGETKGAESDADSDSHCESNSGRDADSQSERGWESDAAEEKVESETAVGAEATTIPVAEARDAAGKTTEVAMAISDPKPKDAVQNESSDINGRVEAEDEATASEISDASRTEATEDVAAEGTVPSNVQDNSKPADHDKPVSFEKGIDTKSRDGVVEITTSGDVGTLEAEGSGMLGSAEIEAHGTEGAEVGAAQAAKIKNTIDCRSEDSGGIADTVYEDTETDDADIQGTGTDDVQVGTGDALDRSGVDVGATGVDGSAGSKSGAGADSPDGLVVAANAEAIESERSHDGDAEKELGRHRE